ncbi:DMT family transporter [Colwelliaceae bacterium BS250]
MNYKHFIELVTLSAIWGASFMFMRIASPELGPVTLISFRAGIGFLTLLPFLLFYKQQQQIIAHWRSILIVALTNTAIPFVLFAFATLTLSAGLTSVLNATAPIFTALVAYIWFRERLTTKKTIGLIVGFLGVIALFIGKGNLRFDATALAIVAALLAALNYGYAACYAKIKLAGVPPLVIATGSQFFATLVLLPILPFVWPQETISNTAIYATIILGVLCTALAYIFYFRLLASLGPEKAITVTYLIPVFGIAWGMLFLAEQLSLAIIFGTALILLGVGLTTGLFSKKIKT